MSQPAYNKPSPKGAWSGSRVQLRFYTPLNIYGTAEASRQILCDCRLYQLLAFGHTTVHERGKSLEFYTSRNIFGIAKTTDLRYCAPFATRSTNLEMTNCPLSGRGQGHVTHSSISHPLQYLWNG